MIQMVRIKRFTAALLVMLFVAALVPQTQVFAGSVQTTQIQVYNYLVGNLGFNTAAACGLMANAEAESGFNVMDIGDGNTSFGLFQWHAGRKSKLINFCKEKKLNYQSVEGQLKYLEYELKKSYKNVYNYLKSVDNTAEGAYKAGYHFCYYFEIPSNREVKSAKRGALARDTYWKKYSKYNGKQIPVTSKVSTSSTSSDKSSTSSVSYTRKLQVKSNCMYGEDILYMQKCLKKLGYKIDADGYYGNGTATVVKQFQKANGLKVDGIVGADTWKAIVSKSSSGNAAATTELKITQQPKAVTVDSGKSATFTVKASGNGLSYQWYTKKAGQSSWTKWAGHTTAKTSANSNDSWDGMQVRCTVKDSSGKQVNSNAVKVTVNIPLAITQQPKSITINCSDTGKFTVKATGKKLSYQWYIKKAGESTWTKWSGHTTATTSAISNTSWNGMQVRCVIKDGSGKQVTSKAAKVTLVGNLVAVG